MHSGKGTYVTPEAEAPTGAPAGTAQHWEAKQRDCEEPMPKRCRVEDVLEEISTEEMPIIEDAVPMCPTQRQVLSSLVGSLDPESSVVITNPLQRDNPIVFVTRPWERMCGFSYAEAVGRNPRLTQGDKSDDGAKRQIGHALGEQRSCKVMMLNYRRGLTDRPFWNMLSISPIVHSGQLMFFLANLQDYSYHMSKLVSTPPTQFCRSAEYHQHMRHLPKPSEGYLRLLARPSVIETDDTCELRVAPPPTDAQSSGALQMKRLGWAKLSLDPEHLTDRVCDCLASMDARYELVDGTAETDDVFVVNAELIGVACRMIVARDPSNEGAYRIACSRLGGDTFAYHQAFRELRERLGDAIHGAQPLTSGGGMARNRLGGGSSLGTGMGTGIARGGMCLPMLAPLPELPPSSAPPPAPPPPSSKEQQTGLL
mmetsp:Transcript_25442/g.64684  ORF Transcript_25442/g.64684 Transcript_25442/m.64684 type:complete len:426 (-) Transcript_25442:472-1749(-)